MKDLMMKSVFNFKIILAWLAVALVLSSSNGFAQDKAKKKNAAKKGPLAPIEDVEGLPRVLLIGDSISIGYTLPVREGLKGKANVHRPQANCGPTTNGLKNIDAWLGDKKWDVIHFNWGLHDLKYLGPNGENLQDPNDPKNHQQVPPAEYEKNLTKLVERLKKTEAKLIWRNTTPVPEGAKGRVVGDSAKYNEIAAKVMKEQGVRIHDMFGFVKPKQDKIMLKANVHFSKEGSKELATDVVNVITKALEK
jgi:lysophospholipase L1-like esterase